MRLISILIPLVFLAGLAWVAFGFQETPPLFPVAKQWRHTIDGWERMETWKQPVAVTKKPLHPLTVGGFQLLASLTALAAFSNDRKIR